MSRQVRRSLALALVGLLAGLGLVVALFGGEAMREPTGGTVAEQPATPKGEARALADPGTLASRQDPAVDRRDDKPGQAGALPRAAVPSGPANDARAAGSGKPNTTTAGTAAVPRFDIVRVEPNGDAVVAGQGAPHAVVEMLVNGKPVARATADADGQFAVVPPALPAGSSQIRLRMTGQDGRAAESEQSVAVEVAPGRDRQPLVALTAPDAATVVLSQPGAAGPDAKVAAAQPGAPAAGPSARIASVDVQENGRLFVTATGAPGAALRLYLNDTLIAPGRIGPDGQARFTIGRGMKPGQYQVRIDQIDPATGKVETRAEVPLSVPEPTLMAARERAEPQLPTVQGSPQAHDGGRKHAQGGDRAGGPGGVQAGGHAGGQAGGLGSATGSTRAASDRAGATAPGGPDPRNMAAEAGADATVGSVFVPEINTAKITRGDNLWRISQRTYGRGERYTVIYDANQAQIRNPDLIYPGQIFVLPSDKRG
ncbi:LysM peptidoglycan-binding domain-containing protein [Methylobacterium sp. J-030]|uniref:LysM peptidoglycan-binding domain-containing protein n=1 Tax=Methylobacterium sp. J-030 TaxID=2836627 RepID=UPI001FBA92AF|nr:LysM peptidoglycan-binding domain-containing protein [Methylobacterium sp. J-030]MCJ2068695.1 LysM peptidoglycan-binding domain-containing protein [Methylobacterium sp. J-030]